MKKLLTIVLVLSSLVGFSQKTDKRDLSQIRLFKLEFKHKPPRNYVILDTVPSRLIVIHRMDKYKPSIVISGFIVHTTKGISYLDCEYKIIPKYYHVKPLK